MRCYKKIFERLLTSAIALLFCFCMTWSVSAGAAEIEIKNTQLSLGDEGYSLTADFNISFNQRLEEAVARGVVLYFVADFELTRERWYWFDEKIAKTSQTWRLSYHALTRQYRLYSGSSGTLHQSFETLTEALRVLSRIRSWQVAGKERLQPGGSYEAALRLYLDLSQLPKPFQIEAVAGRDWNLSSDWKRWVFTPQTPAASTGPPSTPSAPPSSSTPPDGGAEPK